MQESFWRFRIPEHNLDGLFLLVGHVSEPRVAFSQPSLSFGKVLVGSASHTTVQLVNNEALPFQFELDKQSYGASDATVAGSGDHRSWPCHATLQGVAQQHAVLCRPSTISVCHACGTWLCSCILSVYHTVYATVHSGQHHNSDRG